MYHSIKYVVSFFLFFQPLFGAIDHSKEISLLEYLLPLFIKKKRSPPPEEIQEKDTSEYCDLCLTGIALVGSDSYSSDCHFGEIHFAHLMVPGKPKNLAKNLQCFIDRPLKDISFSEIRETIECYYAKSCYPLVLVEFPEECYSDGVLKVCVTPAKAGEICVEGNCYSSSEKLLYPVCICPGDWIDEKSLIKTMNFLNQYPFRQVDLLYSPGEECGTTDITLLTCDRRNYRFYGGTENRGIPSTDRNLWYVGCNLGNIFGCDHVLSYQFTSSYNWDKFRAHTGQYLALLPFCRHLLHVFGGYSVAKPTPPFGFRRMKAKSAQASGRYSFQFGGDRYFEQWGALGFDYKWTNNTLQTSSTFLVIGPIVNLTQIVLGYHSKYQSECIRMDFEGEFFWSPGKWLPHQSNSDYSDLRPGAKNRWIYAHAHLTFLYQMPCRQSLFFNFIGQVTSEALLPSEQLGIGGFGTVRGYDERQLSVDNGFITNVEYRTPPWSIFGNIGDCARPCDGLQLLVFWDYGIGRDVKKIPNTDRSEWLMGAGPGIRYTIDPYFTARVDWGFKIHRDRDFTGGKSMVQFNVTLSY